MRVSRDGGKTYPLHRERRISDDLPNQPAAVLIYDNAGCARTFCIDLDSSKGGPDAVQRDYTTLTATLRRLGLPHFADRSPNGGMHIYIPMAEPLPFHDASEVARALEARTPTLDPMPMLGLSSGCIRPPGSRHKTGGHQELIGSPTAAWEACQHGATPGAWRRFAAEVAFSPSDRREYAVTGETLPVAEPVAQLRPLGQHIAPDANYQKIARTGDYDTARYSTHSEARQAVIWSAVAAGWDLPAVAVRLENGTWPGLASLYARYRPQSRHGALLRDWKSAVEFEKRRRSASSQEDVHVRTTRGPKTHAGGTYEQIRTWVNAVDLAFDEDRHDDLGARAVLLAVAEAAQKTGSTVISFGNRSLAVATGLDQSTVGKILKRLAAEDDPLIDLVQEASGVVAHTYSLRVPGALADEAGRRTWKRGKIHGIRAAFRDLGLTAAFAYAALEQTDEPLSGREVAIASRLGVSSAHEALQLLEAFGLAIRKNNKWVIGEANLEQLAERFGVLERVKEQIDRYRAERQAYWAFLGIIRLGTVDASVGTYDASAPPPPPPDESFTLMDMLEDVLGAHLIAETPISAA
ncbi:MarR family transcriptional regulator [Aeromicrobium yanjiei]|uniref:MarR family transcriptional regulator n=1 Tax=Aeromicrobium yanjiei TaxID=2662028 RepID=A0A5Q2MFU1_9ACTN|nr:MarR family transcriptional regulator [Aeromicrobium yanjiei]QGG39926.1 MarR family transcriptional regulator [Aeromicrobium yanjiei]